MSTRLIVEVLDEYPSKNPTEVLLLISLANMANDEDVCWPSVARLAKQARIQERQVRRYLAQFEESGILIKHSRFVEGGQTSNLYQLMPDAIRSHGLPISGSVDSLLPMIPSPVTDDMPPAPDDMPPLSPMTGTPLSPTTGRIPSIESPLNPLTASAEDGSADGGIPSGSSGKKQRANSYTQPGISLVAIKGGKPPVVRGTKMTTDELISHPMMKYFLEANGLKALDAALLRTILDPIKLKTEDGVLDKGNLLGLWDREPGFDVFVKTRIPQLLALPRYISPENILKNLMKLNFVAEDGSKKFPGFYQWKKSHGHFIAPSKSGDAPVSASVNPNEGLHYLNLSDPAND